MSDRPIDFDFFKTESKLAPGKGRLIISQPFLPGHYFSRSTVLLVDYSTEGAVGFILNKPIELPMNEIMKDMPDFEADVFLGGPVGNDQLFFIHTLGSKLPGSLHVKDELWWSGDFDHLKSMIRAGLVEPGQIRFFLGYSGWSGGQLDDEIAEQSWLVDEADVSSVMGSDENFWEESVSKIGGHYELWRHFPVDPAMN
jgi:Putative transcriptional regulator